jgi:hypothetical protein
VNRGILVTVFYLAAMVAWIYGIVEPSVGYGSDAASVIGLCALITFHVAIGCAIGRGWAPLLALTVPVIAYPAGYAERGEFLIWQSYARAAPIGALLLFAGVALRHVLISRRRPSNLNLRSSAGSPAARP